MPHSPLPSASTQPTGPAYRSLSMCSSSRISSTAAPVGVPPTAAVGGPPRPGRAPTSACRGGQRAADPGAEVLQVGQPDQVGTRLAVELVAQRPQRLAHRGDGIGVFLGVLRRRQQCGAERLVLRRVVAARRRARQDQRADLAAGLADQQFGSGADHAVAGEGEAVGVPAGQPARHGAHVDGLGGGREQVLGQHHLAQVARLDRRHRLGDRLLPLRSRQASVLPAHRGRAAAPAATPARPATRGPGGPARVPR